MKLSVRRGAAALIGSGTLLGALAFAVAPTALADDPPPPPNCTAADFAGVNSGVSAATSAYLFTHPDVNAFFTGLHGKPRTEIKSDVQDFFNANPQARDELTNIRQPLVDIKNRCGFSNVAPTP